MSETVKIGTHTKEILERIRDEEDHTSYDSVIKSLTRDRELAEVLQSSPARGADTAPAAYVPRTVEERPPLATDDLRQNRLYVGPIGSGRTCVFNNDLRQVLQATDARVLYVDPFGDRADHLLSITDSLSDDVEMESMAVPGTLQMNPLICPSDATPTRRRAKVAQTTSLIRALLHDEAGMEPQDTAPLVETLERIVDTVYHEEASGEMLRPTIDHFAVIAREMRAHPGRYVSDAALDSERERVSSQAQQLQQSLDALRETLADSDHPVPATAPGTDSKAVDATDLLPVTAASTADAIHLSCSGPVSRVAATLFYATECALAADEPVVVAVANIGGLRPIADQLGEDDAQSFDVISRLLWLCERTDGTSMWALSQSGQTLSDWSEAFFNRFTTYLFKQASTDPWRLDPADEQFVTNASASEVAGGHYIEFLDVAGGDGDAGAPYYVHVDWTDE